MGFEDNNKEVRIFPILETYTLVRGIYENILRKIKA